jgi:glycosyltransferase involved in cell wall biosynthesis
MSSKALVSVIIPFLNAERFIQEAIESVFAQTYDSWELLLVDDGSTDASTDIALRYAAQHHGRVRYLEHDDHQNRGASASRNLGGRNARGVYIAFLDADDVWLPRKLERQVAILESQPEAAMVYGPGLWWYSWTGKPEDMERDYVQELGVQPDALIRSPKLLTLFLQNEDAVPSSFAILVRREILERVGGSEESFLSIYDDQVVFSKIALAAPIYVSGECWYRYRQHADQRCHVASRAGQYHSIRLTFLAWLEEYLRRNGIKNREVWKVLRKELRPYRHPDFHRLLQEPPIGQLKISLKWIARHTLPASVRQWLRAYRERFGGTTL